MLKLLLSLFGGLVLAVLVLQLRQQWLNLNYQTNRLHGEIESHQAELWNQQMRIAEATAPDAIAARVRDDKIPLAPADHPGSNNWIAEPRPQAARAD